MLTTIWGRNYKEVMQRLIKNRGYFDGPSFAFNE